MSLSRKVSQVLLSAFLIAVMTDAAAAQVLKLRGCDHPRIPVGVLNASGTVRYQIGADGRTVTNSVAALSSDGASLPGLQSAAERQLSACRFDARSLNRPFPVAVEAQIKFDSLKIWFSDPVVTLDQSAPAPVADDGGFGNDPMPVMFPLVDERPRVIRCKAVAPPRSSYSSDESTETMLRRIQLDVHFRSGGVVIRYVVRPDGKVSKQDIQVLATSNPLIRDRMLKTIAGCRFSPARAGGVPVAVVTTQLLWF